MDWAIDILYCSLGTVSNWNVAKTVPRWGHIFYSGPRPPPGLKFAPRNEAGRSLGVKPRGSPLYLLLEVYICTYVCNVSVTTGSDVCM
jgi:hypothetical protein